MARQVNGAIGFADLIPRKGYVYVNAEVEVKIV